MTTKFELNAMVVDETLKIELTYNKIAHKKATVTRFMELLIENLAGILEHIKNEEDLHFSSSDFAAKLGQEGIDALFDG